MKQIRWQRFLLTAAVICLTGCGAEQQSSVPRTTTKAVTEAVPQIKSGAEKLKEKVDLLKEELSKAQTEMNAQQQAYADAQKKYTAAQKAVETYKTEHSDIVPYLGKGTLGFFEYCGAEDAVDILTNAKYASSTKIGEQTDATSLENMNQTFAHMKNCNLVRQGMNVQPLKVTDRLMAMAESELNWADEHLEASDQFDYEENIAFGVNNPYQAWYDDEREEKGEHYSRMLNEEHTLTGFAYCNAKRGGMHEFSHLQIFSRKSNEKAYTVEEYETRFQEYYTMVSTAETELNQLISAVNSARDTVDEMKRKCKTAEESFQKAEENYNKAQSVYEWYT